MIFNMARVGARNTGLSRFSQASLRVFHERDPNLEVLCQQGAVSLPGVLVREMPRCFGIRSRAGLFGPVLWLLYAVFRLASPHRRVVSLTHHVLPRSPEQIAVVHDLRPLYFPDSWLQYVNFKYLLPRALRRISAVVTVSEATRSKLIEVYGLEPGRVHVVPNVIDAPSPAAPDDSRELPYLLMVGATWPHKNAHEVIEMAAHWRPRFRLKILSGATAYRERLAGMVVAQGLQDQVDFVGFVPEEELKRLIRNASALVYPSLDEGFGIPPLEALSVGVPVIVSDLPVFREVVGDAAFFIQLGDPESWRRAFLLLDDADEVACRLAIASEVLARYSYRRFADAWQRALAATWPELFPDD
jgi:glycosyltransferase involved in cell wall biosynthesis